MAQCQLHRLLCGQQLREIVSAEFSVSLSIGKGHLALGLVANYSDGLLPAVEEHVAARPHELFLYKASNKFVRGACNWYVRMLR